MQTALLNNFTMFFNSLWLFVTAGLLEKTSGNCWLMPFTLETGPEISVVDNDIKLTNTNFLSKPILMI